jgi:hypothetical protein
MSLDTLHKGDTEDDDGDDDDDNDDNNNNNNNNNNNFFKTTIQVYNYTIWLEVLLRIYAALGSTYKPIIVHVFKPACHTSGSSVYQKQYFIFHCTQGLLTVTYCKVK